MSTRYLFAWPKPATEIVDAISDETGLNWDTDDSNINVLASFIEEHCDPAEFEKHVRECAESDLDLIRAEQAEEIASEEERHSQTETTGEERP